MIARVLRPPAPLDLTGRRSVFLAGSIEMGLAGDWQAEVIAALAESGKQVVCCPEGYWRKGNIEVVCARYRIPLVESLPELIEQIRSRLG